MRALFNKMVKSFVIILVVGFVADDLFSQTYDQNPADIQEIERYYDGNGVLQYRRDYPDASDNDAWAGKNATTSLTQNTFRLIYTWVLGIPTNATITSATVYIGGTAHSNAQLPIVNIQYQIKKFPDDKYSAQPSDQWNAITGTDVLRTETVPLSGEFDGELSLDQSFIDYLQSSLSSGKLHISIRGTDEETFGTNRNVHYIDYKYTQHNVLSALRLVINYTVAPTNVDITAQNNFIYGTIKVGVDEPVTQQNSPYPVSAIIGQTVNLEAQNQSYDGYERVWNDYAPLNQSKWTKNGLDIGSSSGYSFTVTQNDDNAIYEAGLRKNYAISRDDQTEFDGTTSAGVVTHIVEQNSGNVPVLAPFSQNGKTYNFGKWIGTSGDNFTPTNNTTLTAFYKGHFLSNDINGLSSNSQRKLVRTDDGIFHLVYESLGQVWYTHSLTGDSVNL